MVVFDEQETLESPTEFNNNSKHSEWMIYLQ